jgi:hypothetical protein
VSGLHGFSRYNFIRLGGPLNLLSGLLLLLFNLLRRRRLARIIPVLLLPIARGLPGGDERGIAGMGLGEVGLRAKYQSVKRRGRCEAGTR